MLDDVGQVELALRVVVGERGDPLAQQRGRRRQHAGVDLVDRRARPASRRAPRRSRARCRRRRERCGRGPRGSPRARSAARGGRRAAHLRDARRTSPRGSAGNRRWRPRVTPSAGSAASATRTASPVPRGGSCVTNVRSGAASACRTASPPWPTTTHSAARRQRARRGEHVRDQRPAGERVQHLRAAPSACACLGRRPSRRSGGERKPCREGQGRRRRRPRRKGSNDTTTAPARGLACRMLVRAGARCTPCTVRHIAYRTCARDDVDHRGIQPEGRRRQDDDRAQPARGDRASAGSGRSASISTRRRTCRTCSARTPSSPTIRSTAFSCASVRSTTSRGSRKSGVVLCPAHLELVEARLDARQERQHRHPPAPRAARARSDSRPGRHRHAARCSTCCRSTRCSPATCCSCPSRAISWRCAARARSSAR